MKLLLAFSLAFLGFFTHADSDRPVPYRCPKGWNRVNSDSVYCNNPQTGTLLVRLYSGEVIKIRDGQTDKYCPTGWTVEDGVHMCGG